MLEVRVYQLPGYVSRDLESLGNRSALGNQSGELVTGRKKTTLLERFQGYLEQCLVHLSFPTRAQTILVGWRTTHDYGHSLSGLRDRISPTAFALRVLPVFALNLSAPWPPPRPHPGLAPLPRPRGRRPQRGPLPAQLGRSLRSPFITIDVPATSTTRAPRRPRANGPRDQRSEEARRRPAGYGADLARRKPMP